MIDREGFLREEGLGKGIEERQGSLGTAGRVVGIVCEIRKLKAAEKAGPTRGHSALSSARAPGFT